MLTTAIVTINPQPSQQLQKLLANHPAKHVSLQMKKLQILQQQQLPQTLKQQQLLQTLQQQQLPPQTKMQKPPLKQKKPSLPGRSTSTSKPTSEPIKNKLTTQSGQKKPKSIKQKLIQSLKNYLALRIFPRQLSRVSR